MTTDVHIAYGNQEMMSFVLFGHISPISLFSDSFYLPIKKCIILIISTTLISLIVKNSDQERNV